MVRVEELMRTYGVRCMAAWSLSLCGCAGGVAVSLGDGLRSDRAPRCDGDPVPWTDGARRAIGALVSEGLRGDFLLTPLGLRGSDGAMVLVVEPGWVVVDANEAIVREDAVPHPSNGGVVEYWKVTVKDRFADGALIVREQGTVQADGSPLVAIELVCASYVRGAPALVSLGGVAQ